MVEEEEVEMEIVMEEVILMEIEVEVELYSPISTVFAIILSVQPISSIPLLPRPIEAAVVPDAHFSIHSASAASIFHHISELHP